ncbi:MAG: hypothetical protein MZW92_31895 [Comamonadaceae bacterium]|nr:hypothetical protein [Comamonadaceae bacterium]
MDDVHNNRVARLTGGAGSVQERTITDYDGTSKVAAVASRWATNELAYPAQLDNAYWAKTRWTVTPNAAQNERGETTLELMTEADQLDYKFTNSLDGWTPEGPATLTAGATFVTLDTTGTDGRMIRESLSFSGATFRFVIVRMKRTIAQTWEGVLYYKTAGHSYSASYYKVLSLPTGIDSDFVEVVWDMHALTVGGTDWQTSTITGLQFDFTNVAGGQFQIDWISHSARYHSVYRGSLATCIDNDSVLGSIKVRAAGRDGIRIYISGRNNVYRSAILNLTTLAITNISAACTAGVVDLGGGLYRFWLRVADIGAGATVPDIQWRPVVFTYQSLAENYAGDGRACMYVGEAQLERNVAALGEFIDGGASLITLPNATTVYDIIDRPNACYNTFKTCQDKPNYVLGTQTYQFVTTGAPVPAGETLRPYIKTVKFASTEIDPDAGIARRASVSVTLFDEPCPDLEADPYAVHRASTGRRHVLVAVLRAQPQLQRPLGAVAARLPHRCLGLGRLHHRALPDRGHEGPSSRDEITLTLKDPLKFTDRMKVPQPTARQAHGGAWHQRPATDARRARWRRLLGERLRAGGRPGDPLRGQKGGERLELLG